MKNLDTTVYLEQNIYYFFCCAGLGDTMITVGLKAEIESHLGGNVCFIVKESHKCILDMYGESQYFVVKDKRQINIVKSKLKKTPQKGHIYAAHPCLHPEMKKFFKPVYNQVSTEKFIPWFCRFFQLGQQVKIKLPTHYPEPSVSFIDKCKVVAPIEKIVLMSPEATSMQGVPAWIWEEKVKLLKSKGYVIVSNVLDPKNTIAGTKYLKLSSYEALILGLYCNSVYSIRSGLCDLLFCRGSNLHVFYPSHSSYYLYSLNDMFGRNDIDEQIVLNR